MKAYREIYVKQLNEKTSKEEKQTIEVISSGLFSLVASTEHWRV